MQWEKWKQSCSIEEANGVESLETRRMERGLIGVGLTAFLIVTGISFLWTCVRKRRKEEKSELWKSCGTIVEEDTGVDDSVTYLEPSRASEAREAQRRIDALCAEASILSLNNETRSLERKSTPRSRHKSPGTRTQDLKKNGGYSAETLPLRTAQLPTFKRTKLCDVSETDTNQGETPNTAVGSEIESIPKGQKELELDGTNHSFYCPPAPNNTRGSEMTDTGQTDGTLMNTLTSADPQTASSGEQDSVVETTQEMTETGLTGTDSISSTQAHPLTPQLTSADPSSSLDPTN